MLDALRIRGGSWDGNRTRSGSQTSLAWHCEAYVDALASLPEVSVWSRFVLRVLPPPNLTSCCHRTVRAHSDLTSAEGA